MKYSGNKCEVIITIPHEISRSRGKIHGGLATSWLSSVTVGDLLPIKFCEGCLRPALSPAAPLLMVAIGTGEESAST